MPKQINEIIEDKSGNARLSIEVAIDIVNHMVLKQGNDTITFDQYDTNKIFDLLKQHFE